MHVQKTISVWYDLDFSEENVQLKFSIRSCNFTKKKNVGLPTEFWYKLHFYKKKVHLPTTCRSELEFSQEMWSLILVYDMNISFLEK
jgi:hypothetical protein